MSVEGFPWPKTFAFASIPNYFSGVIRNVHGPVMNDLSVKHRIRSKVEKDQADDNMKLHDHYQ